MVKHPKPTAGEPKLRPTERERAVDEQVRQRRAVTPALRDRARPPATAPKHPDETDEFGPPAKMLGTANRDFAKGLLRQLIGASARAGRKFDGDGLLFALGTIKAMKPRDELEAMEIAQMVAIHAALMKVAGDLDRAEYLPQRESAMRALNQLARTYTAQLDALKRYRSGPEPKVTVQTVSVAEGGQAIVGPVTQATHGAEPADAATAPPPLTDTRQSPMDILSESERVPVRLLDKRKR